jgi:membrane associated rhomboid family serine protease
MLERFSYRRSESGRPGWSMTTLLLVTNAVCFLLQVLTSRYAELVDYYFALSTDGMLHGFVWQLITFQFMHGGFLHLLLNSVAIYCFGHAIEETLGSRTFLKIYFASGIIGGLVQILCAVLWPHYFGNAVMGASAGGFGLIAAFTLLFPDSNLILLLFFIIPVKLKAKFVLLGSVGFAIYGILSNVIHGANHSVVAHAAHLGGMLTGIAYVRWIVLRHRAKTTPAAGLT